MDKIHCRKAERQTLSSHYLTRKQQGGLTRNQASHIFGSYLEHNLESGDFYNFLIFNFQYLAIKKHPPSKINLTLTNIFQERKKGYPISFFCQVAISSFQNDQNLLFLGGGFLVAKFIIEKNKSKLCILSSNRQPPKRKRCEEKFTVIYIYIYIFPNLAK